MQCPHCRKEIGTTDAPLIIQANVNAANGPALPGYAVPDVTCAGTLYASQVALPFLNNGCAGNAPSLTYIQV